MCSDHIAVVKAFEGWKEAKHNGTGKTYCWDNFLSPVTLQMMEDMRIQFLDLLSNIGFLDKSRGANVSSLDFKGPFGNIFVFCFFLKKIKFIYFWIENREWGGREKKELGVRNGKYI